MSTMINFIRLHLDDIKLVAIEILVYVMVIGMLTLVISSNFNSVIHGPIVP